MANAFVHEAARVCAAGSGLGAGTAVLLQRESGPAGLLVDSMVAATDELRLATLTEEHWRWNPVLAQLRKQLAIVGPEVVDPTEFNSMARRFGYTGDDQLPVGIPLLGPRGWFGTVVYMATAAPSIDEERRLAQLATELSVWCVARGIGTLPEVRGLAQRQHQVATLAASGRTNPEIAEMLGISVNTVKLRLKQAYERLAVDNRTALGAMLRRLAPLEGVAPGITHADGYTITRYQ